MIRLKTRNYEFSVAIARGSHPFPFRTRKLSLSAPMVLHGWLCGRVGRRRILFYKALSVIRMGPFFLPASHLHPSRNPGLTMSFEVSAYLEKFTTRNLKQLILSRSLSLFAYLASKTFAYSCTAHTLLPHIWAPSAAHHNQDRLSSPIVLSGWLSGRVEIIHFLYWQPSAVTYSLKASMEGFTLRNFRFGNC